jgi:hypothetical protein
MPRGTVLPFTMVKIRLPESPRRAKGRSGESYSTCKINARVSSRSPGNEKSEVDETDDAEEVGENEADGAEEVDDDKAEDAELDEDADSADARG